VVTRFDATISKVEDPRVEALYRFVLGAERSISLTRQPDIFHFEILSAGIPSKGLRAGVHLPFKCRLLAEPDEILDRALGDIVTLTGRIAFDFPPAVIALDDVSQHILSRLRIKAFFAESHGPALLINHPHAKVHGTSLVLFPQRFGAIFSDHTSLTEIEE
jgi:hypothetical protein